jgi:hypothetical protein
MEEYTSWIKHLPGQLEVSSWSPPR